MNQSIETMKSGAVDFLTKPLELLKEAILEALKRDSVNRQELAEVAALQKRHAR